MTFPILWINHTTYAVILYYKENVKIRYILDLKSPLISPQNMGNTKLHKKYKLSSRI